MVSQFGGELENLDYDSDEDAWSPPAGALYDVREGREWSEFEIGPRQCEWLEAETGTRIFGKLLRNVRPAGRSCEMKNIFCPGLEAACVYVVRMRAHNKAGFSGWCEGFRLSAPARPPGQYLGAIHTIMWLA